MGSVGATVEEPIDPVRQVLVLPRVFVAKLPKVGAYIAKVRAQLVKVCAQVANLGLHPPDDPNNAAKAGQPAQNGHRQIERVNQVRCHTARVARGAAGAWIGAEARGRLGGLWFDTTVRRLPVGSPRTGGGGVDRSPQGRRRERRGPEDLPSLAQDDWLRLGEVEFETHAAKHVATEQ